jgi:hypothetical protein
MIGRLLSHGLAELDALAGFADHSCHLLRPSMCGVRFVSRAASDQRLDEVVKRGELAVGKLLKRVCL